MKNDPGLFDKKKVLITGASGFIGTNLSKWFKVNSSADVLSLGFRRGPMFGRADQVDLKGSEGIKLIVDAFKPDFVFHLAAKSLVQEAQENPWETYQTNVMGTVNLLEALKGSGVQSVVVASTDKVYGRKDFPYLEEMTLEGNVQIYEASKVAMETVVESYRNSFNLPIVISRFGNVYGPYDINQSRLIPHIIKSCLENKPVHFRSFGDQVREYLYVDDVVHGYLSLADYCSRGYVNEHVFNFGSGYGYTAFDVAKLIFSVFPQPQPIHIDGSAIFNQEIPSQILESKRAEKILGWGPTVSLPEGLGETIKWWRGQ